MNKTYKAITVLIAQDYIQEPKEIYKTLSDLITNDLFGLMGEDWDIEKVSTKKPHIKKVLRELAFLINCEVIQHRHAKQILCEAWETDPFAWDIGWFLLDSKILEEKSGEDLDQILLKVIQHHAKAAKDIKDGKKKAVGSLIGPVMKETKGKVDPKIVRQRILELIESQN